MKNLLLRCASLVTVLVILTLSVGAESSRGWYISKRGNKTPGFPQDADYISEHSCFYIDKHAAERGEKVIYLTFDAGYENGNVARILDTLKEEKVPAAFFILSNLVKKNRDLVCRMFDEGHLVCNHTKNHKNMSTLTKDEMKANLAELESLCLSATGHTMPKYFRYPEGVYSKETVANAEEFGYKTFFWSMAYADWDNASQPSADAAIKALSSITHPGAILLLHPTSATNAEILPKMISLWREMGYRFSTLDELVLRNTR